MSFPTGSPSQPELNWILSRLSAKNRSEPVVVHPTLRKSSGSGCDPIDQEKYLDALAHGATIYVAEDVPGLPGFFRCVSIQGNEYNAALLVSLRPSRTILGTTSDNQGH